MPITKRTVIDQIELNRSGGIQIRLAKLIEEDGVPLTDPQYHRTSIETDGDPVAQMAAVNDHLESMGHARVEDADVARIAALKDLIAGLEESAAYDAALAAMATAPSGRVVKSPAKPN